MITALKGYLFFTARREASINYMMQFLKSKARDTISGIYDASVKVMSGAGMVEERVEKAVDDA